MISCLRSATAHQILCARPHFQYAAITSCVTKTMAAVAGVSVEAILVTGTTVTCYFSWLAPLDCLRVS